MKVLVLFLSIFVSDFADAFTKNFNTYMNEVHKTRTRAKEGRCSESIEALRRVQEGASYFLEHGNSGQKYRTEIVNNSIMYEPEVSFCLDHPEFSFRPKSPNERVYFFPHDELDMIPISYKVPSDKLEAVGAKSDDLRIAMKGAVLERGDRIVLDNIEMEYTWGSLQTSYFDGRSVNEKERKRHSFEVTKKNLPSLSMTSPNCQISLYYEQLNLPSYLEDTGKKMEGGKSIVKVSKPVEFIVENSGEIPEKNEYGNYGVLYQVKMTNKDERLYLHCNSTVFRSINFGFFYKIIYLPITDVYLKQAFGDKVKIIRKK